MPIRDLFLRKKSCPLLVNASGEVAEKYNLFMDFLANNRTAMGIISGLEHLYYKDSPFTLADVEARYQELRRAIRALVEALNGLAGGKYAELSRALNRLNREIAPIFAPRCPLPLGELVLPLEALTPDLVQAAGPKATNLAVLHRALGAPVPPGFVITSRASDQFFRLTGLSGPIESALSGLSPESAENLDSVSREIREMILRAQVPEPLATEILQAYQNLEARTHYGLRLAMRSSAVREDTEASFAGQYDTVLNVTRDNLLAAYRTVLASKYSPRAIWYRWRYGLEDYDTLMCVAGIMMINSRVSGVLYTVDPARPDSRLLKISSIWGLGEHLVSGEASPDEFWVDKETLTIDSRVIGRKTSRLVNLAGGGTLLEAVPEAEQELPSLDDDLVLSLARLGQRLEE